MTQIIQIVGALLVLAGYVLVQSGRTDQRSLIYLLLNLFGSGALAVLAFSGHDWGFLLLEGSWALVTGVALVRQLRRSGRPLP